MNKKLLALGLMLWALLAHCSIPRLEDSFSVGRYDLLSVSPYGTYSVIYTLPEAPDFVIPQGCDVASLVVATSVDGLWESVWSGTELAWGTAYRKYPKPSFAIDNVDTRNEDLILAGFAPPPYLVVSLVVQPDPFWYSVEQSDDLVTWVNTYSYGNGNDITLRFPVIYAPHRFFRIRQYQYNYTQYL